MRCRPDLDADFLVSDATNAQIAETCFLASATVESAIQDLVSVGFIHRRQRRSRSSLTTIYRTPGNFGEAAGSPSSKTKAPEFEAIEPQLTKKAGDQAVTTNKIDGVDVPALAAKIVAALDAAGIERPIEYDVAFFQKWIALRLEKVFFFPSDPEGWTEEDEEGEFFDEMDSDACASCIAPVLPKILTISRYDDMWVIIRHPEDLARRLLKLIRGEEIAFGSFGPDIRHRLELAPHLETVVRPGSPIWKGIEKADNPAAYLNTAMRTILSEYDKEYAAEQAKSEDCDDDEPEERDGGDKEEVAYADEDYGDYADEEDSE